MADNTNDRDIFGPSETKPGTSGHMADSGIDASGTEQTHATNIDHDITAQEWGRTHSTGSSTYDAGDTGMTGHSSEGGMHASTADQVREKAAPAVAQVKEQASQALDQVQHRAYGMIDEQKGRAAGMLGDVAGALRTTGQQLHQQNQGQFGHFAERAADSIDNFSQQLNNKGVDELFHEAENFARREPQVFLGGAVLAGILLARFFKSSTPKPQYGTGSYGQGYMASQGQYGRSFERGGMAQGYTRRERGGIERMDQDYDETWTGEDFSPPTSTGPIS